MFGGFLKFVYFIFFSYISFDNANSGHIFLHAGIQVIIAIKNFMKYGRCFFHDQKQNDGQKTKREKENKTQFFIDKNAHDHAEDECKRCSYRNTNDHLKCILNICNIGRHSCNQAGCTEFIDIGKGIFLYMCIHAFSQITGKARRCTGRIFSG